MGLISCNEEASMPSAQPFEFTVKYKMYKEPLRDTIINGLYLNFSKLSGGSFGKIIHDTVTDEDNYETTFQYEVQREIQMRNEFFYTVSEIPDANPKNEDFYNVEKAYWRKGDESFVPSDGYLSVIIKYKGKEVHKNEYRGRDPIVYYGTEREDGKKMDVEENFWYYRFGEETPVTYTLPQLRITENVINNEE